MEKSKVVDGEMVMNTSKKKQGSGTGFKIAVLCIAGLALILSAGSAAMSAYIILKGDWSGNSISSDGGYYLGEMPEFEEDTIAGVAEKVSPAVVSILTETEVRGYFGGRQTSEGAGTGMIVSADGYVLTNSHVVDGADRVTVVSDAGDTYEDVEVVGVDPLNDVAYLKIPSVSNLPTVTLGDSKGIAVGMPVLAIGNALGVYQNSITEGIVSGTGRSITASGGSSGTENLSDMIQTDAAINPGNSGGPLVNAAGEVIGINTAVSTSAQGLGFAIPISSVKGMLKSIQEKGKAERAYLGVQYLAVTAEVAKEYDLPVKKGAYIYSGGSSSAVIAEGPADKAGIKDQDILISINGVEVGTRGSILSLVGEYMPGETVKMGILRNGHQTTLEVTLGAYPTN